MKKQVVVIHGGDNFKSYGEYIKFLKGFKMDFERLKKVGWKDSLRRDLGRGFDVILPKMPNPTNARYLEWRLWFRKLVPFLEKDVVLVGHSLGGIFLAKYLAEEKFPKRIRATFLVAAPYDDKDADYALLDFKLPKSLAKLAKQGGKIFVYQSKDDSVVPFADFQKYKKVLPNAHSIAFRNKGHFGQERFPELVKEIKRLFRK